ncbi:hypothetical protein ACWGQT_35995, partial [Streptomyces yangpuensis]
MRAPVPRCGKGLAPAVPAHRSATAPAKGQRDSEVGLRLNRLLDEEGIDHLAVDIADDTREALVLFETGSRRSFHIVPPGPRLHPHEGER